MSILNPKHFKKFLIVEGNDDLHVIANIWKNYAGEQLPVFYIDDSKGFPNVYGKIESYCLKKRPNVEVIGIIVDADENLRTRWESLKYSLEQLGYNVPQVPDPNGTILRGEERNPDIGLWLMPDNDAEGMLEDFVKHLIPEDDFLLAEADLVLEKLEREAYNKYHLIHKSKARIHTWLAWQEDPGTPMGLAITKTYLTTDSEVCRKFVEWLNELFNS
ncbi:DUF3226 domain-containing protein [Runella sp.]|uniref:DUF3226 domain-containing protein n=1 Tax=Runella sp. TaxID=1960881 RepID=UPI003D141F6E